MIQVLSSIARAAARNCSARWARISKMAMVSRSSGIHCRSRRCLASRSRMAYSRLACSRSCSQVAHSSVGTMMAVMCLAVVLGVWCQRSSHTLRTTRPHPGSSLRLRRRALRRASSSALHSAPVAAPASKAGPNRGHNPLGSCGHRTSVGRERHVHGSECGRNISGLVFRVVQT